MGVSGWSDGKVRSFLPQSGKLLYVINDAHKNGVTSMAPTSDCSRIVTGGMEGEVRVWKIGRQMQTMDASLNHGHPRLECGHPTGAPENPGAKHGVLLPGIHARRQVACLGEGTFQPCEVRTALPE